MSFIAPEDMKTSERLPGWHGRHWRSKSMSFAYYEIAAGAAIHPHHHPHEEVWLVIEGELDVTIDGVTQRAGPGAVAVVPPDATHAVRALARGRAVVANHPVRDEFV
jgi:quercetin dioxygenase-like cupin family protein